MKVYPSNCVPYKIPYLPSVTEPKPTILSSSWTHMMRREDRFRAYSYRHHIKQGTLPTASFGIRSSNQFICTHSEESFLLND